MLCDGWLAAKQFNPLALLERLQVEANEKVCAQAVEAVFEQAEAEESELQFATATNWGFAGEEDTAVLRLSPEGALFWRVQCEYLRKAGKEEQG